MNFLGLLGFHSLSECLGIFFFFFNFFLTLSVIVLEAEGGE
jgi:hypothetical protein